MLVLKTKETAFSAEQRLITAAAKAVKEQWTKWSSVECIKTPLMCENVLRMSVCAGSMI